MLCYGVNLCCYASCMVEMLSKRGRFACIFELWGFSSIGRQNFTGINEGQIVKKIPRLQKPTLTHNNMFLHDSCNFFLFSYSCKHDKIIDNNSIFTLVSEAYYIFVVHMIWPTNLFCKARSTYLSAPQQDCQQDC